jgi:hypothetical protein
VAARTEAYLKGLELEKRLADTEDERQRDRNDAATEGVNGPTTVAQKWSWQMAGPATTIAATIRVGVVNGRSSSYHHSHHTRVPT